MPLEPRMAGRTDAPATEIGSSARPRSDGPTSGLTHGQLSDAVRVGQLAAASSRRARRQPADAEHWRLVATFETLRKRFVRASAQLEERRAQRPSAGDERAGHLRWALLQDELARCRAWTAANEEPEPGVVPPWAQVRAELRALETAVGRVGSLPAAAGHGFLRRALAIAAAKIVARLSRFLTKQHRAVYELNQRALSQVQENQEELGRSLSETLRLIVEHLQAVHESLEAGRTDAMQIDVRLMDHELRLVSLHDSLHLIDRRLSQTLHGVQASSGDLARRVAGLEEQRHRADRALARIEATHRALARAAERSDAVNRLDSGWLNEAAPAPLSRTQRSYLHGVHARLQGRLRGDRELIKRRLACYLPDVGRPRPGDVARALDLGCGRGEWLELLAERGWAIEGVEPNKILARQGRRGGLAIRRADALTELARRPTGSLALVTAFHLLEHLDFVSLVSVLAEARRTLCAGGLAIFETPNPDNLLVGAGTFAADPTHRRPLSPALLRALLEESGFVDLELRLLRADREEPVVAAPLADRSSRPPEPPEGPVVALLRERLTAALDYAYLCRSPA